MYALSDGRKNVLDLVKNFNDIKKGDVAVVGGKGANLGEMTGDGINVPGGFVVTSESYRYFLRDNGLDEKFREEILKAGNDEGKLKECAKSFREMIVNATLPDSIKNAVRGKYEELGIDERVAVRSSATAEDLPDASFAGEQETYLNVIGIENVYEQIKNCYASLWGNRAVIYRQNQGYDQESVALAVVIQKMIESESAGVLFTVNPITHDVNEMQINASYGLGESVVSGRVTADSYVCTKDGDIKSIQIGTKETEIVYDETCGNKELIVSGERRDAQTLSAEQIRRLCKAGLDIEKHYGMPMDIEWAIQNDEIYILQARAITTLSGTNKIDELVVNSYLEKCKCTGAQRGNMAFLLEKMPFVFYPYDYELIEVIDDQKSNILAEAGIIMDMQPTIDDDGVMILPPNGVRINGRVVKLPSMLREFSDMSFCRQKLENGMQGFHEELKEIVSKDYESMSLSECKEMNDYFVDYVRRLTYHRFKYALFPSAINNKLKFTKILSKIDKKLTSYDLYKNLDYETAVMTKDIERIALVFSENEQIVSDISNGMNYYGICSKYPKEKVYLDEFLAKHGYKSDFNCYCITAKTFYEEPNRIISLVRPLLVKNNGIDSKFSKKNINTSDYDTKVIENSQDTNEFEILMSDIKAHVSEKKYETLKEEIDAFRYMHVIREESQLMWETTFFYVKKMLKRAAKLLFDDENYMNNLSYLFLHEVSELINELENLGTSKKEIIERYTEIIKQRKEKRPLAEAVWEGAKLKVFNDTGDVLKGISGSVGEVTGKVCIINGPDEFYKLQKGDVLVCKLTDPEWTPLFSLASAVVADTGAELSHAAIVAREYGIPAVLGVGFATINYKDGDRVHVNGTKGCVSRVG